LIVLSYTLLYYSFSHTPATPHTYTLSLHDALPIFQPMQQFRYTTGKNATDSAMIIDAVDLLYTGPFAGFCLVSSDSDFTRLASRDRKSTRLNSSHQIISYAVFCLKKKNKNQPVTI